MCNICRQERGEHSLMVLVRCKGEAISTAKERRPLCLIDYCVCDDCTKSWRESHARRQRTPMIIEVILAAISVILGITSRLGFVMFIVAAILMFFFTLSIISIVKNRRKSPEELAQTVFCDFFFRKGGIPKQIIKQMPSNNMIQNVKIESRSPYTYMLMTPEDMNKHLSSNECAATKCWRYN